MLEFNYFSALLPVVAVVPSFRWDEKGFVSLIKTKSLISHNIFFFSRWRWEAVSWETADPGAAGEAYKAAGALREELWEFRRSVAKA